MSFAVPRLRALVPAEFEFRIHSFDDDAAGAVWFSEYGFEQTRPFRALKIWMAIHHLGLDGYRQLIRHATRFLYVIDRRIERRDAVEQESLTHRIAAADSVVTSVVRGFDAVAQDSAARVRTADVISDPPPTPVMPTSIPTANPEIE